MGMPLTVEWKSIQYGHLLLMYTHHITHTRTYILSTHNDVYTYKITHIYTYTHIHLHTYAFTHDCQHPHTIEAVCRICYCKLITKTRPDYKCLIYHLISNYMTNPLHLMNRKLMSVLVFCILKYTSIPIHTWYPYPRISVCSHMHYV